MFTYMLGLVFRKDTREAAANVTGVATSLVDGSTLPTYGLDGQPGPVVTNADGYYSGFKSTESRLLLSFGDVGLVLLSVEAIDAGDAAREAAIAAGESAEAAQDAANRAATAELAVTTGLAGKADKVVVDGIDGRVRVLEGGTVELFPVASFTFTVNVLAASFDASASTAPEGRTITEYRWTFGDGTLAYGPTVTHDYATGGTRAVTLAVVDSEGVESTSTQNVTVLEPANVGPSAVFTSTVNGLTVQVDGRSSTDPDGTIVSYEWAFGAGATATGSTASYTYPAGSGAAPVTVALTVTDDDGATSTTTRAVTLVENTAPPAAEPVYVLVQSPTPTAGQASVVSYLEAHIGRALDYKIADDATAVTVNGASVTPAQLIAQDNVQVIVTDGVTLANVQANLPNLPTVAAPVLCLSTNVWEWLGYSGVRVSISGSTGYKVAHLAAEAAGQPWAGGIAAPSDVTLYTSSGGQQTHTFPVGNLGTGAQVQMFAYADRAAAVSPFYEKGAAAANGAVPGRRAHGVWRNFTSASTVSTAARVLVAGFLDWFRTPEPGSGGGSTPTVAAPVMAPVEQIETLSNGGRIRTTATVADPTHSVRWFSASSFAKNGGVHYATTAAGTGTTRTRETAPGDIVPPGTETYWSRAVDANGNVSPESNHRQITVVSSTPTEPTAPSTELSLLPFGNEAKVTYDYVDSHTGTKLLQAPIWRLAAPVAPTLEPETSPATASLRDTRWLMWCNQGRYGHRVSYATLDDPRVTVTDRKDAGGGATGQGRSLIMDPDDPTTGAHIPLTLEAEAGTDAHAHVVQPDGKTIVEMISFQRDATTGAISASRVHKVRLDRAGLGPATGVRAYGGSAIGGLIRAWEIDPTHPNYTGKIHHPLAVALDKGQMISGGPYENGEKWGYETSLTKTTSPIEQPKWPAGVRVGGPRDQNNPEGFLRRKMPWPITEEDYDAGTVGFYSGGAPMGCYFVIPGDVTPESLGIDAALQASDPTRYWAALMVFEALRDYGGYVVDRASSSGPILYIESSAPYTFRDALSQGSKYPDLQKMKAKLRVVDPATNTPTSPNGAPIGAPRRGAMPGLLPDFR